MKFKIDNLQYCNWSRKVFEINREAGLDAVHVTIVYHEDFDELLIEIKKWEKLFKDNSDLIILDNKDSFTEREWKNLYRLSENTFVEETESLKKGAAGAGLTDND